MPIIESQSADPKIHHAATQIAWRLLDVCSGILMESEKAEFLKQTYTVAREALEAFDGGRKA